MNQVSALPPYENSKLMRIYNRALLFSTRTRNYQVTTLHRNAWYNLRQLLE